MNNRKKTLSIAAILTLVLVVGGMTALAYLTDTTEALKNTFSLKNKYTLEYHGNAGSDTVVVPDKQTNYKEGKFTVSSQVPTREDFAFVGWNKQPDGSDLTTYKPGDLFESQEHQSHLYAQWEIGYTLVYDPNGGVGGPGSDSVVTDADSHDFTIKGAEGISYPTTVNGEETTEAKVFLGWADTKDAKVPTYGPGGEYAYTGTDFVDDKVPVEGTKTVDSSERTKTVYAVWATRYKLSFDVNEKYQGSGNVPDAMTKVSTADQVIFDIPENNEDNNDPRITPVRKDANKGYSFGWWCDDPDSRDDGWGTYQFGEPVKVFSEPKYKEHKDPWKVLYAVYKPPETLGLNYDLNGGSGPSKGVWAAVLTDKQLVDIDPDPDALDVEAKNPKKTNYVFLGWSTDKNAKVADYQTLDKYEIDIWVDARPTMYAVWRPMHRFQIQFHLNGGNTGYYYSSGRWQTNTSTEGMYYYSPYLNTKEEIIKEYTWPVEHFAVGGDDREGGVYATRNSDGDGQYSEKNKTNYSYKFLGWHQSDKALTATEREALMVGDDSETAADDVVDFPVDLPTDPANPNGTGGGTPAQGTEGCITSAVTAKLDGEDTCTSPGTHKTYLYAVWERTALPVRPNSHSFKLIFTNKALPDNKDMDGVAIVDKATGKSVSDSESGTTAKPIVSHYPGGEIESKYTVKGMKYEVTNQIVADVPNFTWEAADWAADAKIPSATKTATATARYVFKGWSYTPYKPGEGTADIPVNAEGRIEQDITISETVDPATDCDGNIHYLLLFPVFEAVPQHTFNVYMVPNFPELSDYNKYFQYQWQNNNSWYNLPIANYKDITDVYGVTHAKTVEGETNKGINATLLTSKNQEVSETQWGDTDHKWLRASNSEVIADQGIRISCPKKSATSAAPEYTFLGWSKTPNSSTVDIPVDNANGGKLTQDLLLKEADVTTAHCSATEGYEHNLVLYGVWEFEPAHQYSVLFSTNMEGANLMAKNSATANYTKQTVSNMKDVEDFNGKTYTEIKQAWVKDGPVRKLLEDPTPEYTWTETEWKDIGVYAEKAKDKDYAYHFKGWAYLKDGQEPTDLVYDTAAAAENAVDVHMDGNGKWIVDDVTVKDNHITDCEGNVKHYAVLYGVWHKEKLPPTHTFSVKFNLNNYAIDGYTAASYKYYVPASSTWKTSSDAKYGTYMSDEVYVPTYQSYEFSKSYWQDKGLAATRNQSYYNTFEFVGWSLGRDGVDPKNLTEADVDITVDENGFIQDTITVTCGDPECRGGEHVQNLYAIWKPTPRTKTYTLKFDPNPTVSGERDKVTGMPDEIVGTETYGAIEPGKWQNTYTFTMPREIPTYKSMAFVGWSRDPYAMPGEYGYPNTTNVDIQNATSGLIGKFPFGKTVYDSYFNNTDTLYAIWAYEYQLTYDANDGYSAPSMQHEYTNQKTHNYTLSKNYPQRDGYEFLGWSTDPNATAPEYYPKDFGKTPYVMRLTADDDGCTKVRVYAVWKKL